MASVSGGGSTPSNNAIDALEQQLTNIFLQNDTQFNDLSRILQGVSSTVIGGTSNATLAGGTNYVQIPSGSHVTVTTDHTAGATIGGGSEGTFSDPTQGSIFFIAGGDGNNTINLGKGIAVYQSTTGNDSVTAHGGRDSIYGGTGHDTVHGGPATYYEGGTGSSTIYSGNTKGTHDTLIAGSGGDVIVARNGNNIIEGYGADYLQGGPGKDTIIGGDNATAANNGTIWGGGQTQIYGGTYDKIHTQGHDSVYAAPGPDTVYSTGNSSKDGQFIQGNSSGSLLVNVDNKASDTIFGHAGHNVNVNLAENSGSAKIGSDAAGDTTIHFAGTGQTLTVQHVTITFQDGTKHSY